MARQCNYEHQHPIFQFDAITHPSDDTAPSKFLNDSDGQHSRTGTKKLKTKKTIQKLNKKKKQNETWSKKKQDNNKLKKNTQNTDNTTAKERDVVVRER